MQIFDERFPSRVRMERSFKLLIYCSLLIQPSRFYCIKILI